MLEFDAAVFDAAEKRILETDRLSHLSSLSETKIIAIKQTAEEIIATGKADSRYSMALSIRAFMHAEGLGGEKNSIKAINLCSEAYALNNPLATNLLALMRQRKGYHEEAIDLYEWAIEVLNSSNAMNNRGLMHQCGKGGPKDVKEAVKLYDRAVALGNPCAMVNRGVIYEYEEQNIEAAAKLYFDAAQQGQEEGLLALQQLNHAFAYFYLTLFYLLSKPNDKKALEYFQKDKEAVIKHLCSKILKCCADDKPDEAQVQILLNFVIRYGDLVTSTNQSVKVKASELIAEWKARFDQSSTVIIAPATVAPQVVLYRTTIPPQHQHHDVTSTVSFKPGSDG